MGEFPCARAGCPEAGTWIPVLVLSAGYGAPARGAIGALAVCQAHRDATTVDELVTDAGWAQIVSAFLVIGRAAPIRTLTKLDWQSVV